MQATTGPWAKSPSSHSVFGRTARAVALAVLPFLWACSDESGSPVALEGPAAASSAADGSGLPAGSTDEGGAAASLETAATWHVATSGSDANPGTGTAPFRSVQKAVNVARAGDTILVHAGTHNGVVLIERRSNPADRPVVIRAAGDGPAILSASFPARSCAATDPARDRTVQILGGSDHWVLQDLEIVNGVFIAGENNGRLTEAQVRSRTLPGRGSWDPDAALGVLEAVGVDAADGIQVLGNRISRRGVHVTGGRRGRIEGNEVSNIDCGIGAAIWINTFSDLWYVARNHVHHVAASEKHFMSEGIRMGRASSYNTVEDNLVEDLAGLGRGVTTDVNASWNTIRRNRAARTAIGFSQQAGGWGNVWEHNESEASRKFGFAVFLKGGQMSLLDASTPRWLRMSCNRSLNDAIGLRIGGVRESVFVNGGYLSVRLSSVVRSGWASQSNTWEGSSTPPGTTPPSALSSC